MVRMSTSDMEISPSLAPPVSKDPCPVSGEEQETAERIIDDLSSGEPSVVRLQPYDPTTEEQTWPTDEAPRNARRNQIAAPGSVSATSAASEDRTKDADESGRDADVASDDDASHGVKWCRKQRMDGMCPT